MSIRLNLKIPSIELDQSNPDIMCFIKINQNSGNRLIDSYALNSKKSTIIKLDDHEDDLIQFVFKNQFNNQFIGSLSINMENFFTIPMYRQCEQWFTLYDDLEDDVYDGEFMSYILLVYQFTGGQDDEDTPRVKLQFIIENVSQGEKRITQKPYENIEENQFFSVQKSEFSFDNQIQKISPSVSLAQSPNNNNFQKNFESFNPAQADQNSLNLSNYEKSVEISPKIDQSFKQSPNNDKSFKSSPTYEKQFKNSPNYDKQSIKSSVQYQEGSTACTQQDISNTNQSIKLSNPEISINNTFKQSLQDLLSSVKSPDDFKKFIESIQDQQQTQMIFNDIKQKFDEMNSNKIEEKIELSRNNTQYASQQYEQLQENYKLQLSEKDVKITDLLNQNKQLAIEMQELKTLHKDTKDQLKLQKSKFESLEQGYKQEEKLMEKNHALQVEGFQKLIVQLQSQLNQLTNTYEKESSKTSQLIQQQQEINLKFMEINDQNKNLSIKLKDSQILFDSKMQQVKDQKQDLQIQCKDSVTQNDILLQESQIIQQNNLQLQEQLEKNYALINELNEQIENIQLNKAQEKKTLQEKMNELGYKIRQEQLEKDNLTCELEQIQLDYESQKEIKESCIYQDLQIEYQDIKLQNQILESELKQTQEKWINTINEIQSQHQKAHKQQILILENQINQQTTELHEKSKLIIDLNFNIKNLQMNLESVKECKNEDLDKKQTEIDLLLKLNHKIVDQKELIETDIYKLEEEIQLKTQIINEQGTKIMAFSQQIQQYEQIIQKIQAQRQLEVNQKESSKPQKSIEKTLKKSTKINNENEIDEIDTKVQEFIKANNLQIKLEKIEKGLYYFGTRKINLKLINGKLGVRMGGGYMHISEFLRLYQLQELNGNKNELKKEKTIDIDATPSRLSDKNLIANTCR